MNTPDASARSLLDGAVRPERYENPSTDDRDVAARIASMLPAGARVLDVGCGTGSVTAEIARRAAPRSILAIEPDPHRAAIARSRGLRVLEEPLTPEFLLQHGPFDAVVFADVLEHLVDPGAFVALARDALLPGGAVVASVPNVAHWSVRMDLLAGKFDYEDCGIMDATHLRWFTETSFRALFDRSGLRVVSFGFTVNAALAAYSVRRPWRWLPEGLRKQVLNRLVDACPRLFGCQLVARAEVPN